MANAPLAHLIRKMRDPEARQAMEILTSLMTRQGATLPTRIVAAGTSSAGSTNTVSAATVGTVQGRLMPTLGHTDRYDVETGLTATVDYRRWTGPGIALYNGDTWAIETIPEGVGVQAHIGSLAQNTNFDVFVYEEGDVLKVGFVAWSGDNARATDLEILDGVPVNATDNRQRYVGTIRKFSSSGVITQGTKWGVWNLYNQRWCAVERELLTEHAYTTATERDWDNDAASNSLYWVTGVSDNLCIVTMAAAMKTPGSTGVVGPYITFQFQATTLGTKMYSNSDAWMSLTSTMKQFPGSLVGLQTVTPREKGDTGVDFGHLNIVAYFLG